MVSRIVKGILGPALWWTVLVSSAFIGIGGMSQQAAPERVIRILWLDDGIVAVTTFSVAIAIFTLRTKKGRAQIARS
jgi:hypothetical protein